MDWIEISDRLPPNDVYVLVCTYDVKVDMNFIGIYKRFNENWLDDHNEEKLDRKRNVVSHWMFLPDEPLKRVERKEKEEIVDKAWITMSEYIKETVKERMSKEDVAYEIWLAIQEGTKEFLADFSAHEFEKYMSKAFQQKFEDVEITVKMRKD